MKFKARVKIPGTNWKQWRNAFQCVRKRITTPIHYMYISVTIWVPCIPIRTRNCVNTLIHILYNFQTIWVQCISMRTQNCINTCSLLVYSLHHLGTGTTLTDVVVDVISGPGLLSLNVNKIK